MNQGSSDTLQEQMWPSWVAQVAWDNDVMVSRSVGRFRTFEAAQERAMTLNLKYPSERVVFLAVSAKGLPGRNGGQDERMTKEA